MCVHCATRNRLSVSICVPKTLLSCYVSVDESASSTGPTSSCDWSWNASAPTIGGGGERFGKPGGGVVCIVLRFTFLCLPFVTCTVSALLQRAPSKSSQPWQALPRTCAPSPLGCASASLRFCVCIVCVYVHASLSPSLNVSRTLAVRIDP